uniref:Uncharacterized protein n=2 Tax=Oryza TaxID=4527 RepID=A0A0D3HCT1_9ORYZ
MGLLLVLNLRSATSLSGSGGLIAVHYTFLALNLVLGARVRVFAGKSQGKRNLTLLELRYV